MKKARIFSFVTAVVAAAALFVGGSKVVKADTSWIPITQTKR